jgi:hypothetical protein
MGGNIFTSTHPTVRLDREAMEGVSKHLRQIFDMAGIVLYDIPSFGDKDSFGDIDMIAVSDAGSVMKRLENWRFPVSKNGNVVSFLLYVGSLDVPEFFQCDIICFPTEEQAKTAVNYFAYNDLGNLIGRLYHSIGFKYGHDGLSYVRRDGDYQVYTMPVSTDIDEILKYIRLCPLKFHAGFKTLEEIFEYVASSPYYHPSIYLLENRNHTSRVRDRKRKTYMEFLKWSETHPKAGTPYAKPVNIGYLIEVLETFNVFNEYITRESEYAVRKKCKEMLNGDIVGKLTGLSGKDLGAFMSDLRKLLPDDLLSMYRPKQVERLIIAWYERKMLMDDLLLWRGDVQSPQAIISESPDVQIPNIKQ